jgi:hypothetical protein
LPRYARAALIERRRSDNGQPPYVDDERNRILVIRYIADVSEVCARVAARFAVAADAIDVVNMRGAPTETIKSSHSRHGSGPSERSPIERLGHSRVAPTRNTDAVTDASIHSCLQVFEAAESRTTDLVATRVEDHHPVARREMHSFERGKLACAPRNTGAVLVHGRWTDDDQRADVCTEVLRARAAVTVL